MLGCDKRCLFPGKNCRYNETQANHAKRCRVFLLSPQQIRQLYRRGSLHPPGYTVTAGVPEEVSCAEHKTSVLQGPQQYQKLYSIQGTGQTNRCCLIEHEMPRTLRWTLERVQRSLDRRLQNAFIQPMCLFCVSLPTSLPLLPSPFSFSESAVCRCSVLAFVRPHDFISRPLCSRFNYCHCFVSQPISGKGEVMCDVGKREGGMYSSRVINCNMVNSLALTEGI